MGSRPPKVSDEQGTANEEDARDAANAPAPACASAATLLLLLPCGSVVLCLIFIHVCVPNFINLDISYVEAYEFVHMFMHIFQCPPFVYALSHLCCNRLVAEP